MKAKSLHICFMEAAEVDIEMTFSASLTQHLPRLLPLGVRKKLQGSATDPAKVAALAEAQGYPPGELLHFAEGPRVMRVWLE